MWKQDFPEGLYKGNKMKEMQNLFYNFSTKINRNTPKSRKGEAHKGQQTGRRSMEGRKMK